MPHEVAFEGRAGRVTGFERTHLLGHFVVAGLDRLRRTGEFPQIVLPVLRTGRFAVVGRFLLLAFGPGFGGRLMRRFFLHFFQKRIFQQLALHGFHKLETGKLQEADGLLQLGSHHQLLRKLELLSEFQCHASIPSW